MKKFTLILVATLMAVAGAWAQSKAKVQSKAKRVPTEAKATAPKRPVLKVTELNNDAAGKSRRQLPKAMSKRQYFQDKQAAGSTKPQARKRVAASKSQRRAAGIIIDQPEGTYYNMVYSCSYFGYIWIAGQYSGEYTEALGEVVEGNDGCLYLHNLLTEMKTEEGYWVKAEKVEGEADTYVIHEQPIYLENYFGEFYTYSIMKMVYNASEQEMEPAPNTDIKITWKNGTLRTAAEFNNPNTLATTISAIDDSGYWSGAMNWNITMTPQTEVAITQLPTGVEAKDMIMKYITGYEETESEDDEETTEEPVYAAKQVRMAVSGNDIYLQYYEGTDGWIKGTINGTKASFANMQYLGADLAYGQHAYFIATEADYGAPEYAEFDYDPATSRLSNSNLYIFANAGKIDVNYMGLYINPEIFAYVETAGTPQPINNYYSVNYNPTYGYGYVDFDIPYFDTEGNYMNPEKLYYKVYVGDDENNAVFTFTPEEYPELSEPMTEIPFLFYGDDFWSNDIKHEFVTYVNHSKNFGIQVIYKGGGEEHTSDITWCYGNNGAAGYESVFPEVENPVVNSVLADGEMALNLGEVAYAFGSGRDDTETFDVAMKIEDSWTCNAKLSGKKITALSIPFINIEGISNAKAWLSTTIDTDADGKFTPDGPVKEFTLTDNGYTTIKFDEPYEIPEEGLYLGYTFTQAYDIKNGDSKPIALTGFTNIGGFMIHSDKVYRLGWASMEGKEGDLGIEAILTGCENDAAEIYAIKDVTMKTGEKASTLAKIVNYGNKGLNKIAYDYKLSGYNSKTDEPFEITGSGEIADINLPRVFGAYNTYSMEIPAIEIIGDHIVYADITKVNDQDNAIEDNEAQGNVFVMNFVPKKRPLLEEYTGTWCGYCPRGFVGLEKMNELYPEDFVALSYHNADPMEITTLFPNDVEGFPSAFLDRSWAIDAYSGFEEDGFAIDKAWLERCEEFGIADIDVEAAWSEDMKTINIKSTTTFARNEEGVNYQICYAITADGLTGTTSEWAQSNYYSDGKYGYPEFMEQFTNGDSYVSGLVFNDVIVATSDYYGIEGSLPENVVEGTPYTHQFSFNADEIVNTSFQPVIQDKSKLKAIAMIVNWGSVVNANKCKVADYGSAINDLTDGTDRVVKTRYFDLSGREVSLPSNGVYIQSKLLKDGKKVNNKIIIK